MPSREQLERTLRYMLDENEFLSPHGIRSLSQVHREHPFVLPLDGRDYGVHYTPAESDTTLFGGNSNWRGPVWFPVNYLLIEALERYHHFYGDDLRVECPTGSGRMMNLGEVARELSRRLAGLFVPTPTATGPATDATRASGTIRIGATWSRSASTSAATPAARRRALSGWTTLAIRCFEDLARSRAERR